MRHEGLNQEVGEDTYGFLDRDLSLHPLHDPCFDLVPVLVDSEKAGLASALDKLIGLDHKLLSQKPRVLLKDKIERMLKTDT